MDGEELPGGSLPLELEAAVRAELRDDEQLLWVGQPRPSCYARRSIFLVLFGIPWTAFALFWMAGASGMLFAGTRTSPGGAGVHGGVVALFSCFPLFGLPFVAIGLGMLSSPYWLRRQARRTCYALTDRRAILRQAGVFGSVDTRSYEPAALGRIHRREYAGGCGDLVFEEVVSFGRDSDGDRTTNTTRYGFLAIEEVREVENLLRTALLSDEGGKSA